MALFFFSIDKKVLLNLRRIYQESNETLDKTTKGQRPYTKWVKPENAKGYNPKYKKAKANPRNPKSSSNH